MSNQAITFKANPEHGGIAFVVPVILLASLFGGYFLFLWLLPIIFGGGTGDYLVLAGLASMLAAIVLLLVIDPILKNMWPSGHEVDVDEGHVRYRRPEADELTFDLNGPHRLIHWHFKLADYPRIGRERQINRNWHCCSLQLQQDEGQLVLHTFLSQRRVNELTAEVPMTELDMSEIFDSSLTGRIRQMRVPGGTELKIPPSLITSDRGRYWLAERQRWQNGVELDPKDFATVVQHLKQYRRMQTKI